MQNKLNILLIEDDTEDALLFTEMIKSSASGTNEFGITHVQRLERAVQLLGKSNFDLVLVDLGLPDSQGIETFKRVNTIAPHLPVIVLTGLSDEKLGNIAVHDGAQDYLVKSEINDTLLKRSVLHAIERKQITEDMRKSELLYRDLTDQLTEANTLKDLLLDVITHDLRNNAGAIYGFADILYNNEPENELCQHILRSSGSLLKVIENAATMAKLSHGENIKMTPIDVDEILREVIKEFTPDSQSDFIKINYTSKGPLVINANPIIAEIFRNYISNAIRYGYDGGIILIDAYIMEHHLIFKVTDYGNNIPEDKREIIFDRLVKLSDKKNGGSGLGLAIVKRISEAHNGSAWVEPNIPKGNTFCVKLPADN